MAKKNSIISVETIGEGADLFDRTIMFVVEGAGDFQISLNALSAELRQKALIHGLVQKVSDAAAMPKADLPADPVEAAKVKFEAMKAVADRLIEGDWSKRSGDGSGPVARLIYRAFEQWVMEKAAKAKKTITAEQIRATYDAKSRAEQLALRSVPEIAEIIEQLKAERGATASKVDTSALLDELGI